jgi:sugar phosphate isomerase/epimerase
VGFDFIAFGMAYLEENKPEDVLSLCEKLDLPIDNIHLTGGKTTEIWNEGEIGDKVVKRYCKEIRLCSQYGIKKGVAHVTWGHQVPGPVGEIGLSRLEKIAQVAEECGFVLGLENSVYPEYLYASMDYLKNYKSIGHTFDSGHRNAFAPGHDFHYTPCQSTGRAITFLITICGQKGYGNYYEIQAGSSGFSHK